MLNSVPTHFMSTADILIVDDTVANLQLLTGMLKERGYKARPVPSGRLALQAAQAQPPDLILLDINMPEMDGFAVCAELKSNPLLCDIPVIFISALNETLDKVRAFSAGGVDYITKPFQIEEVEARLSAHLRLRRLQSALQRSNAELLAANEELRRLQVLRDNLTHMIVHDLRSPLGGILGYHELLMMSEGGTLSERASEYLAKAHTAGERLISLVNSLLDLSKLEAGELRLSPTSCDLAAMAREVSDCLGSTFEGRQVAVLCEGGDHVVEGDRELLTRVLQNLIANALRFTPEFGVVTIRIEAGPSQTSIRVIDSGPGIAPADHQRIFEKFGQVERTGPRMGTGLGLAFCRLAVEAHGGTIGLESDLGKGSTFWFQIPRSPVASAASPS